MSATITETELDTFQAFTITQESSQQNTERFTEGDGPTEISRRKASLIIVLLTGISLLNTMGSGILTVVLPTIAHDISLSQPTPLARIYLRTCLRLHSTSLRLRSGRSRGEEDVADRSRLLYRIHARLRTIQDRNAID